MLRRAEDVRLTLEPLPHSQGWLVLQVGAEKLRLKQIDQAEFRHLLKGSTELPLRIATIREPAMWMFQESYFWDDEERTQDEAARHDAARRADSSQGHGA